MAPRLRVITGPMFSGKTERLIWRAKRALYAKQTVLVAKYAGDTRTGNAVASRAILPDGMTEVTERLSARLIVNVEDLRCLLAEPFDTLAIDEVQFFPFDEPMQDQLGWFGREIRAFMRAQKSSSKHVILAGLDTDYAGNPFGIIAGLLAIANDIEKVDAVCMKCGAPAPLTEKRTLPPVDLIEVGDFGEYQAVCRKCHTIPA